MQEKVLFKSRSGSDLCGILSDNGEDTKPVIILCHGMGTGKDALTCLNLEKTLNKGGAATFRFDFFGHGESIGDLGDLTLSEAVNNIFGALDFLKNRGYRDIGLFGASFGGAAAILAASRSKDFYALALKSPVSDYFEREIEKRGEKKIKEWKNAGYIVLKKWDGSEYRRKYDFFEDLKRNKGYLEARNIRIPTLIIHGDNDQEINIQQSKKLSRVIKKSRLEIFKGADHKYSRPKDFGRMISLISSFLLEGYQGVKE